MNVPPKTVAKVHEWVGKILACLSIIFLLLSLYRFVLSILREASGWITVFLFLGALIFIWLALVAHKKRDSALMKSYIRETLEDRGHHEN
jgi:hypothetical protein